MRFNAYFFAATIASCLTASAARATTQAPVALGSNAAFAVLGGTTVTVTGGGSITGNIGIFPGSAYVAGVPPVTVNGTIYAGGPVAAQAQADLTTAFNDAAGRQTPVIVAGNIGGLTLTPGLYKSTSSLAISSGDLTLDAQGNANAVFIFQIASTFTMTSGRSIILAGGASSSNIFWQVGSSATLGTTTVVHGNILAAVSISLLTGSTLDGRALAQGGAVTIDTGGGSSATVPGGNVTVTAPTVISTSPENGANAVQTNQVTASFSVAMNPTTINATTFTLTRSGLAVPGTVTYSGVTAAFTPATALTASSTYSGTITTGAKSTAGTALATSYIFSFNTAAAPVIPVVTGTLNDATYTISMAPGSIAAVFGSNLSVGQSSSPMPTPLLYSLSQSNTDVSGLPAPLFFASPGQVNIQLPWALAGQTQATLTVTVNGTTSAAQNIAIVPFAPGIFSLSMSGAGQGTILLNDTRQLAAAGTPATAGGWVSIFCTGLGAVSNQPATGASGLATPLSVTSTQPTVTIGGVNAIVNFSGLAPGWAGLYQVNALVPQGVVPGNGVPVTLAIGGAVSNTVTIAVQ